MIHSASGRHAPCGARAPPSGRRGLPSPILASASRADVASRTLLGIAWRPSCAGHGFQTFVVPWAGFGEQHGAAAQRNMTVTRGSCQSSGAASPPPSHSRRGKRTLGSPTIVHRRLADIPILARCYPAPMNIFCNIIQTADVLSNSCAC
jgi:hypothetical protein